MWEFLRFCGYMAILLAIVPLAGICVTGSWRGAWEYVKVWDQSVGLMLAAGAVLFLIVVQLIPSP